MPAQMIWKSCVGFPDYEVSECGDVRRATDSLTRKAGFRLKGSVNSDGYREYALRDLSGVKHHVTAHALVAWAFLGPQPSATHEVAHNNGSRVDCHFRNLRWDTRKGNHADLQQHGTASKGVRNGRARLSEDDVMTIRHEHLRLKRERHPQPLSVLSSRFRIHPTYVCSIVSGKSWSHLPLVTPSEARA